MTAAEKILKKTLVGSSLNSREWNLVQAGLRDRAFFSSQVESAKILHAARKMVADRAGGHLSASEIRRDVRKVISSTGYRPPEGKEGTLQDLYSKRRLDTIIRTNVEQARGYVRHLDGMKPGAFAAFPGQELIRVRERKEKRDWATRWKNAGGRFYNGRMIALRDDPIWERISVFGNPFPPFDWGSGMGVRAVSRRDCVALGVVTDNEVREKVQELKAEKNAAPGMNDNLQAELSFRDDSPEADRLREVFGDQVDFRGNTIHWKGELMRDVLSGKVKSISLGVGYDGEKTSFSHRLFADHAVKHLEGNEQHGLNLPMHIEDYELLPSLWRSPDRVTFNKRRNASMLELDLFDGNVLTMLFRKGHGPLTVYKKAAGSTVERMHATPQ